MRTKDFARAGAAFLLGAFALAAASPAAAWPERTVKFILPLGPGAGVDVTARMVADRLSKKWDQPVVVENRPGGDAMVAITAFISAHDDHTLLFSPAGSFTAHPYLHDKMPYDPRELAPIARVTNTIVGIGVPVSLNLASLKDLVALARAKPGTLNWVSATGTNEFLFNGFLKTADLSMARVPYRDTVQALNDLSEGRIQMFVGALAIMRPFVQAGKVKVLAVTNRERAATMPDVPTVKEAGYPELGFDGLVGLFGRRDMPNDLRERIAADVRAVIDQEIITRLTAAGQAVTPGSAAEFEAEMKQQRAQIDATGKLLGMKAAQSQ